MKKLILLFLSLTILSCGSNKTINKAEESIYMTLNKSKIDSQIDNLTNESILISDNNSILYLSLNFMMSFILI